MGNGIGHDLEMSIRRIVQDIMARNDNYFYKVPMAALTAKKGRKQGGLKFYERAPVSAASVVSFPTATDQEYSSRPLNYDMSNYYPNYRSADSSLGNGLKNFAAFVKVGNNDVLENS